MRGDVIFDLDGTLVDSCGVCVEILTGMLRDRGSTHTIDPAGARFLMSHGGARMVSELLGPSCRDPEQELQEFRRRYRDYRTPPEALFPGVFAGLTRMRDAGFRLSICSNKPQDLCESTTQQTGIAHFFDKIVGGAEGRAPKPAPDLLELVMQGVGARRESCIFVGDSELDYAIARDAGLPFVLMTYGYAEPGWRPDDGQCYDEFLDMAGFVCEQISYQPAC